MVRRKVKDSIKRLECKRSVSLPGSVRFESYGTGQMLDYCISCNTYVYYRKVFNWMWCTGTDDNEDAWNNDFTRWIR